LNQSGTASVSGAYGSPGSQATLTGSADAIAQYGALGAASTATFTISGGHAYADGVADFYDGITVDFAPFTGQTGFLVLDYTLHGTAVSSGAANAMADVNVLINPGSSSEQEWEAGYSGAVSGTFSHVLTFVYGQEFGLLFNFSADTGTVVAPGDLVCITCSGSGSGSASFFNTLTLSGRIPEDRFGNPVDGASFLSAAGTQYGLDGVVPEPSSLLTLGSAVAVLWLLHGQSPKQNTRRAYYKPRAGFRTGARAGGCSIWRA